MAPKRYPMPHYGQEDARPERAGRWATLDMWLALGLVSVGLWAAAVALVFWLTGW